MTQPLLVDLKTAATLSGATGILGAATVPLILAAGLEFLPPEQSELPLPVPLFCAVLAVQIFVLYGALGLAGLRMARRAGHRPAPLLTAAWTGAPPPPWIRPAALAFGTGLVCGLLLVLVVALIQRTIPDTLPSTLHPPSPLGALLGSATASFGEEILCRLFLLSGLLWWLSAARHAKAWAIWISAVCFAALHSPALVFLSGGIDKVSALCWIVMLGLNTLIGVVCGRWYLRAGIGCAILVHGGTDLVWHVLSQLV